MEKIAAEICFKTGNVTTKFVHLDNGWIPNIVKVKFNNSSDCNKVKDHITNKMKHLELSSALSDNSNELVYKYGRGDGGDKYRTLGIDEKFDFSYFNDNNPFSLQLAELTSAFLDGYE